MKFYNQNYCMYVARYKYLQTYVCKCVWYVSMYIRTHANSGILKF